MNRDELEQQFSEKSKKAWSWAVLHQTLTIPFLCFVIGFVVGRFTGH